MHSAQQARPRQAGRYITLFWLRGTGLRRSRTLPGLPRLSLSARRRHLPAGAERARSASVRGPAAADSAAGCTGLPELPW